MDFGMLSVSKRMSPPSIRTMYGVSFEPSVMLAMDSPLVALKQAPCHEHTIFLPSYDIAPPICGQKFSYALSTPARLVTKIFLPCDTNVRERPTGTSLSFPRRTFGMRWFFGVTE